MQNKDKVAIQDTNIQARVASDMSESKGKLRFLLGKEKADWHFY